MLDEIRNKLIELARLRTTWTYSQFNEQLNLGLDFRSDQDRALIGDWLGEISRHEFEKGRPLLSSLVTHKLGRREQGDGFYKLCEELLGTRWEELKADKEWENKMIADCYTFWLIPENFKQFKFDF